MTSQKNDPTVPAPKNLENLLPSKARSVIRGYIQEAARPLEIGRIVPSRVTILLELLQRLEKDNEMPVGSQLRYIFDEEFRKVADERGYSW